MKKYALLLLAVLCIPCACIDDKGNYSYKSIDETVGIRIASGIEEEYSAVTAQKLTITPVIEGIENEDDWEYRWYVYPKTMGASDHIADTLSYEKNLDYTVSLKSGDYYMYYRIARKSTGVALYHPIDLKVASIYNNMWVVTKDDGTNTDIDVVLEDGTILPNVLAATNNGDTPVGTAIRSGYCDRYRMVVANPDGTSTNLSNLNILPVVTTRDVKIYDINSMKLLRNYEDLFYQPVPPTPELSWSASYRNGYSLIIGGRLYALGGSNESTVGKFSEKAGDYVIGKGIVPYMRIGSSMFVFFDEKGKSLMRLGNFDEQAFLFNETEDAPKTSTNMGCDLMHLEEQWVFPNKAGGLGLFRDQQTRKVYSAELDPQLLQGPNNPIETFEEVPADRIINRATHFANNMDVATIYFVHPDRGNELWSYDLGTQNEKLQVALGEGEQISYIKHVVSVLSSVSPTERVYMRVMVILTNNGGNWKLHLYDFLGETPDLNSESFKVHTGVGSAKHAFYKNPSTVAM